MPARSVVVVGLEFGGLSMACYLSDAGLDVTVLEKNEQLGGRASVPEAEGFRFDMEPSWYLMPDVFERFFSYFDRRPADYYDLAASGNASSRQRCAAGDAPSGSSTTSSATRKKA